MITYNECRRERGYRTIEPVISRCGVGHASFSRGGDASGNVLMFSHVPGRGVDWKQEVKECVWGGEDFRMYHTSSTCSPIPMRAGASCLDHGCYVIYAM